MCNESSDSFHIYIYQLYDFQQEYHNIAIRLAQNQQNTNICLGDPIVRHGSSYWTFCLVQYSPQWVHHLLPCMVNQVIGCVLPSTLAVVCVWLSQTGEPADSPGSLNDSLGQQHDSTGLETDLQDEANELQNVLVSDPVGLQSGNQIQSLSQLLVIMN